MTTPEIMPRVPQEVFPDATVEAKGCNSSSVTITCNSVKIASVSQRDLYRKYRWPAAPEITQKLQMFKEEMES